MDVPRSVEETREFWSGQHVVVAVDGDTVLGSAKMGPNRPAQGAHVGTASFMVGTAARGRGIGRAMGEYAVEWHRANGFAGIQFNAVVSTNTAAITAVGVARLRDDRHRARRVPAPRRRRTPTCT